MMDTHALWPFKYINDKQTPESKALESLPPDKPLEGYNLALSETTEEAML